MTPTHAWARRGERAAGSVPSSWGSTTVIAALGLDGVRAPLIFPGATDTQAFQTYVDQVLVPELRPGDVVVFDNLKPHLSRHVAESIERAGATVLPLPPYSSDYDPIEELWSKLKLDFNSTNTSPCRDMTYVVFPDRRKLLATKNLRHLVPRIGRNSLLGNRLR